MMRLLCIGLAITLAACATAPETRILTREVRIPTPVKCAIDPGPAGPLAATPETLAAAPDVFEAAKLVAATVQQLKARLAVLEAANAGCR